MLPVVVPVVGHHWHLVLPWGPMLVDLVVDHWSEAGRWLVDVLVEYQESGVA